MPASQMAPSQMDRPTGHPYEYGSQVQGGVFGRCAPLVPGHREARPWPSPSAAVTCRDALGPTRGRKPHVQWLINRDDLDAYSI